jgi:hypothetical protein
MNDIFKNIINCGIAGILVLLGALSDGKITKEGFFIAVIAGLIVFFTQFKNYWQTEELATKKLLFNFINL